MVRASGHLADFSACNKTFAAKNFSERGTGIMNAEKFFLSFIVDTSGWSLNTIPKTLPLQGLSEPKLYGDLVFRLKKSGEKLNFLIKLVKSSYVINERGITLIS